MAKIDAFFKLMNEQKASDVHLVSGQQPVLRIRGDLGRVKYKILDDNELRSMLYEITPEDKIKVFEECFTIDLLTDPAEGATYTALNAYAINIASILGTNTAYVGFTGSTGAGWENQDIVNWTFANSSTISGTASVPALSNWGICGLALLLAASAALMFRRKPAA